nr:hypothetical protein [Tanacetum cinerariifolium]
MCEMVCQIFQKKQEEKRIEEEQAASAQYWKIPTCCDDEDDYDSAITPVLSTEETDNSLNMGDEHLDIISATESDEVIKSSVEDLVPIPSEFEGILDTMCDVHFVNNPTPLEAKDHVEIVINSNDDISSSDDDSLHEENIEYVEASPHDSEVVSLEVAGIVTPEVEEIEDDNLCEKLLNVHLLIANIEALKDNPTPSSELLTKSSSTSLNSLLEETNTFHNSLHEFENFYFDLGEISSGSTTTHSDISLPDYEAFSFDNDHIEEISSGSTTTQSDISLSEYDLFIFDFANEEFVDKLAHIISPPEYDCFYFWNFPDPVTSVCEMFGQFIQKKQEEKRIEKEQAANAQYWKIPACCDDDDDYNSAITPNEPFDSLSMGDEHPNTVPVTKSDEFIKSSVENLVPKLSESEGENGCDVPACFTTFSNVLFDADYDFYSVNDQSFSDEDLLKEIYLNHLFDEEIIPMKIDRISLMLRINETDCYPEEETHFTKRLLYDNSSPRPPEEFLYDNSDADIESFSPSPIPVEDNDLLMEEIDLYFTPDDPMPPGIEEDDYDS